MEVVSESKLLYYTVNMLVIYICAIKVISCVQLINDIIIILIFSML